MNKKKPVKNSLKKLFKQPKTVVDNQGRTRVEKGHGDISGRWIIGFDKLEQMKTLSEKVLVKAIQPKKVSKSVAPEVWVEKYGIKIAEVMHLLQFSDKYEFPSQQEFVNQNMKRVIIFDDGNIYRYDSSYPLIIVNPSHLSENDFDTLKALERKEKYEYISNLRKEKLSIGEGFTSSSLLNLNSNIGLQARSFKDNVLFFMGAKVYQAKSVCIVSDKCFIKKDIEDIKKAKDPIGKANHIIKSNYNDILFNVAFEKGQLEEKWELTLLGNAKTFILANKEKNDLLDIVYEPKVKVKE